MSADSISGAAPGELIDQALRLDSESHEYWDIVRELQGRGDRATFEEARALVLEPGEPERVLGVHILAQLGWKEGRPRPFLEESLPLVDALSGPGRSASMIHAALIALGHLEDERSAPTVLAHITHPDPEVRYAVVVALQGVCGDPPPRAVLEAFFALMEDPDPDVRDWATFGIGSLLDVDTPEVRDALLERVDDKGADGDIAGEALRGLARRKDERVLTPILGWLALRDPDPGDLILEAVAELGDPRCLPALHALRDARGEDEIREELAAAIDACERGQA